MAASEARVPVGDYFDHRVRESRDEYERRVHHYLPNRAIWRSVSWLDLDGKKVLDVGCGEGYFALPMAERGATVTGIDVSERALKSARQMADQLGLEGVEFHHTDLLDFRPTGFFDVVVCITVLMHTEDTLRALRHLAGLLLPGGKLLLSEPNARYHWTLFRPYRRAGTITKKAFRVEQMRGWLGDVGLQVERVSGRIFSLHPTRRTQVFMMPWLERWGECRWMRHRGEHISILATKPAAEGV